MPGDAPAPSAKRYAAAVPSPPKAPLPKVPTRQVPLERVLWHPFDVLIAFFLSDGFVYSVIALLGFDPLTFPLSALPVGLVAGMIAATYYQALWSVDCKFCGETTPTDTGRCATCLAPLDADPATFSWSPPEHLRGEKAAPGPHGDRGLLSRWTMRWQGNGGIILRESIVFFAEVTLVGLILGEFMYGASVPPTGSLQTPALLFFAALAISVFRPAMNRYARRVAQGWRERRDATP